MKINEIDLTVSYQGYIWLSDVSKPIVVKDETIGNAIARYLTGNEKVKTFNWESVAKNDANPFILEGQLYDEKRQQSFSIKNVEGKTRVLKYESCDLDDKEGSDSNRVIASYIPNRMKELANKKLQFLQVWEEKEDCLWNKDSNNPEYYCLGMKSLVPSNLIFLGFIDDNK